MFTEIAAIAAKAVEAVEAVTEVAKDIPDSFKDVARPSSDKGFELPKSYDFNSKCDVKPNDSIRPKDFSSDFSNMSIKPESPEKIKCRNEELAGKNHPETGVPFEKRTVDVNGQKTEVVAPKFESTFDAELPDDMLKATDKQQFKECNNQLQEAVDNIPELKSQFDSEQLEQIQNGDTPDGYTWHHDVDTGKMQLVDSNIHSHTGHTGGRSIWGGGSDAR